MQYFPSAPGGQSPNCKSGFVFMPSARTFSPRPLFSLGRTPVPRGAVYPPAPCRPGFPSFPSGCAGDGPSGKSGISSTKQPPPRSGVAHGPWSCQAAGR